MAMKAASKEMLSITTDRRIAAALKKRNGKRQSFISKEGRSKSLL